MNGSLCYTRGTGLILGAEKGRERRVWNMFSTTVNFSLQQVNKLINGHQTFEPRKTRRLKQFYATFSLVRSFSHALIMHWPEEKADWQVQHVKPVQRKRTLSLKISLAPRAKIRPLTNPVKNLQIRVDGVCIWKSMRIGYSKETGKSWNLYTVPWTGILTSFLTDRLSPEWMISVANNRHRVLRKPSSYPDQGNPFNSGNVTPSEFLKTVILIVQHRLFY